MAPDWRPEGRRHQGDLARGRSCRSRPGPMIDHRGRPGGPRCPDPTSLPRTATPRRASAQRQDRADRVQVGRQPDGHEEHGHEQDSPAWVRRSRTVGATGDPGQGEAGQIGAGDPGKAAQAWKAQAARRTRATTAALPPPRACRWPIAVEAVDPTSLITTALSDEGQDHRSDRQERRGAARADAATTRARTTRPITSSITAAPRTTMPALDWSRPSSPRTAAVIPTLVAVRMAPTNKAARRSAPLAIATADAATERQHDTAGGRHEGGTPDSAHQDPVRLEAGDREDAQRADLGDGGHDRGRGATNQAGSARGPGRR